MRHINATRIDYQIFCIHNDDFTTILQQEFFVKNLVRFVFEIVMLKNMNRGDIIDADIRLFLSHQNFSILFQRSSNWRFAEFVIFLMMLCRWVILMNQRVVEIDHILQQSYVLWCRSDKVKLWRARCEINQTRIDW